MEQYRITVLIKGMCAETRRSRHVASHPTCRRARAHGLQGGWNAVVPDKSYLGVYAGVRAPTHTLHRDIRFFRSILASLKKRFVELSKEKKVRE
jgi:hypothetical protein